MAFLRKAALLVAPTVVLGAMTVAPVGASVPPPSSLKSVLTSLPSVVPGLAQVGKVVAAVTSDTPIDFSVMVKGPHDAELEQLAQEVSDPTSPDFRHFLTRSQLVGEYDPATTVTDTVVTALRALGISVIRTSSDGRLVDVEAPAGLLSTVLDLRFAYVKAVGQAVERVALNQPTFPAILRPLIADVIGLSATPVQTFTSPVGVAISGAPAPAYFNARPCAAYYNQIRDTAQPSYQGKALPYTICGYTPAQIRDAYRVTQTGLSGQGVRIGVVDDYSSPTMVADADEFSELNGLPSFAPGQFVDHSDLLAQHAPEVVITTPPGLLGTIPGETPQQWTPEETLDVEMEHVMAPNATIEYYGGDEGLGIQPLEAEFSIAIADDQAQFISDSWGIAENDELVTPADYLWMDIDLSLGALEGVGASFSTGDDGDNIEINNDKEVDFPASTSLGTAVGGTSLVLGPNGYYGETYWGARAEPLNSNGKGWNATPVSAGTGPSTGPGTLTGAGGGGVSKHYAEPSWQKAVVPASLTTQTYKSPNGANTNNVTSPGRVVPDISLVADSTTGVLIGQTQTDANGKAAYSEYRIGGTSVSSPLFAGLMALAIQHNGGHSIGFVSPALYAAYAKSPNGFRKPSLGQGLTNVRVDYTDTQNPASALVYHLRLLGQLGSLHYLKGYDDSTGLGTPCATVFISAIVNPTVSVGSGPGCGASLSNANQVTSSTVPGPEATTAVSPAASWLSSVPLLSAAGLAAIVRDGGLLPRH
jgi:subtilase family serine protease